MTEETPKTPPPPAVVRVDAIFEMRAVRAVAERMLEVAELARRNGLGTFTFAPEVDPAADYAGAGIVIERALAHLNESIPNRQLTRTRNALGALRLGVELLCESLGRSRVLPSEISLAPGAVDVPYTASQEPPAP